MPIVRDGSHKNRDLAIEMLGQIGPEAREAKPLLQEIIDNNKNHYSIVNRAKEALARIEKN